MHQIASRWNEDRQDAFLGNGLSEPSSDFSAFVEEKAETLNLNESGIILQILGVRVELVRVESGMSRENDGKCIRMIPNASK